jgi:hypothetical protein
MLDVYGLFYIFCSFDLYLLLLNPSLIPHFPTPCIHSCTEIFSVFSTTYLRLFVVLNVPDLPTDLI